QLATRPDTWYQFDYYLIKNSSGPSQIVAMVDEITTQEETLKELEDDRFRLGLILQYSDLGLFDWIMDDQQVFTIGNVFQSGSRQASLSQATPEDWKSKVHPDDLDTTGTLLQACLSGESPFFQNEFRVRFDGENYHWVIVRGEITGHDQEGRVNRFSGIVLDIHKRKTTEIKHRNNQILLNDILSSTDEGIFVLDSSMHVIFWNNEMSRISETTVQEVMDRKEIFDHFPHLLENGIGDVMRETMKGVISGGHSVPFRLKSGREGYTFEKYLPLKNNTGDIIGVIGFVKDITEEMAREAELAETHERFELTIQAVNEGIWDWNLANDTIILSDRWFAQLGYQPGELKSSLNTFRSLLDPLEADKIFKTFKEAFEKDVSVTQEYRLRHRNGDWVWIEAKGSCIVRDAKGHPVRALGTHSDITLRKQTELKMLEAMEKAEESDRLKSAFLANMSHELRTPLNAIVGFSELLTGEDLFPDEKKSYINQIKSNSENLLQLISNIIDLSRIESNRLEIHRENIPVHPLIREVIEHKKKTADPDILKELTLEFQIPDDILEIQLFTDPIRIKQVLDNLIDNALKFTSQGSVILGVMPPKEGFITFFVKDTGIGINPENQKKIFDRFEQIDTGLTRKFGGTGLGLNLTRSIVNLLGGKIRVESQPGKGSTFFITHPYE
ncbi:MAG: PAS domain-containing protein, partial [Bacteroidales bacterium]|nr:PAS domain-containing protein [Bacteroidales bacterium]